MNFGKLFPKYFQKISFLKILENCFQYSTTGQVCPMIDYSIMGHTCPSDDRVDQRGISHMSDVKLFPVLSNKAVTSLDTFSLEKLILQFSFILINTIYKLYSYN